MLATVPGQPLAQSYLRRVLLAHDRPRMGAVALMTLALSLGTLLDASLFDFFSAAEVVQAWAEHLAELAAVAAALTLGYTLADEALPRRLPLRVMVLCALLLLLSAAVTGLLYAYYAGGFDNLAPPLRLFSDSLRWGLPAVFLALNADLQQRALAATAAARGAELARSQLQQSDSEQQLALLQAQIEPHFLFNVLGHVRHLYRHRPQAGADAVDSLLRYLGTALPRLRGARGTLSDEIELIRSYLDLFRIRMGERLSFEIEVDPELAGAEFPPTLLLTLVENAVKHGLEPAGGGRIRVQAQRRGRLLEVAVFDDGAGFGGAATSGTGVGLVNVRRQLSARYADQARLQLTPQQPRGACAALSIPWRAGSLAAVAAAAPMPA